MISREATANSGADADGIGGVGVGVGVGTDTVQLIAIAVATNSGRRWPNFILYLLSVYTYKEGLRSLYIQQDRSGILGKYTIR
jgi:hypothetical protein